MKKVKKIAFLAITLLGASFNQSILADAPTYCEDWRDSYPTLGADRYLRWDRVNDHVLQNVDYGFRAHGSRKFDTHQDDVYFYSDEDYLIGVDEISLSSGDAKMVYNFSELGTQSIWIMNDIDLGAPSQITLCAKTKVHVQYPPTLNTLTTNTKTINVGWASFYTSGGSMSDVSSYSLQNKQLEYRWSIANADTGLTTTNFTTTTPYTKAEFIYGGEYLVTVVTFDGTFTSSPKMLYMSVRGPRDGGGEDEPSY